MSSQRRRLLLADLPAPFQLVPVKVDGIVGYDTDNAYPSRMERLINSSITAKSAAGMYKRFLTGRGFKDQKLNEVIVGEENYKAITAYDLLCKVARSFSYNNGVYIRTRFTGLDVSGLRVEPFRYCRFGEMDSKDYSGKIIVYNNWDKYRSAKLERGKYIAVDTWNPLPEVVKLQAAKVGGFQQWRGQMYYSFLEDEYIYPLSPIDPVKWDSDTETQIGIFKNGELRRGFFLKYIMHHTQFHTDDEADDFIKKIKNFMGADHDGAIMVLEGTFDAQGKIIDGENVKVEKIEQNINDKMFESYEKSTQNAIRKAFNAIPQCLIDYEDSKLGSTSGEALRQASEFYNEQTIEPRMRIEQIFRELFGYWIDKNLRGASWEIEPLIIGSNGTTTDSGAADDKADLGE